MIAFVRNFVWRMPMYTKSFCRGQKYVCWTGNVSLKELRTEIALQKSYFHLYIIDISYHLTTKMEFILMGIKRFIMKCSNYSYCLCYINCVFVIKCISSKLSGIDGWLSILHFMYVTLYSVTGWTNIELQDPSAGVITAITPWALLIGHRGSPMVGRMVRSVLLPWVTASITPTAGGGNWTMLLVHGEKLICVSIYYNFHSTIVWLSVVLYFQTVFFDFSNHSTIAISPIMCYLQQFSWKFYILSSVFSRLV